jgi:hypothetical protein
MQLAAQALGHQRLAGGSCRHTNRLGTPVSAGTSPSPSTKASEVRSAPIQTQRLLDKDQFWVVVTRIAALPSRRLATTH